PLSTNLAVKARDTSFHPSALAFPHLPAAVRANTCIGHVRTGDHQSAVQPRRGGRDRVPFVVHP
ncbi:MAG: hypothetical protein PVI07_07175, partial [Anaerolineae bacterium]